MKPVCNSRSSLFAEFIRGSLEIIDFEDIYCKPNSKLSSSLYITGQKVASRSQKTSYETIYVKKNFIYLPELDGLLAEGGYFIVQNVEQDVIKYKNFVPNAYNYNYTLPCNLWKAWNHNSQLDLKLPIINWEGQWERIIDFSFHRNKFDLQLKKKVSIEINNFLIWAEPTIYEVPIQNGLDSLSQDLSSCVSSPGIPQEKMWSIIKSLEAKIAERDLLLKKEIAEEKERLKERQSEQRERGKAINKSLTLAKKEISKLSLDNLDSDLDLVKEKIQEAIDTCKRTFENC